MSRAGTRRRLDALLDRYARICPVCGGRRPFERRGEWLREFYLCTECGSQPRMRAFLLALDAEVPDWRTKDIHESSPAGPGSDRIARDSANYVWTHYFPDRELGSVVDGVRNEDLRHQTFADESFDIVITQDVLEHVFEPDLVFKEIARTLRPGGVHIFTVPIYDRPTVVRAELDEQGQVRHLLEPDYHGNPVDPDGSLVVHEWGLDLADRIEAACGMSTRIEARPRWRYAIAGEFLHVGVSRKPGR